MQPTNQTKVIVLGGGYAGTLAALRLAGKTDQQSVEVILVNGHDHFVERIRHHQLAAGQPTKQLPFDRLLAGSKVRFVQGWCTQIDTTAQQIVLQTMDGATALPYDYLIYALGSTTDQSRIPGIKEHAHSLTDEAAVHRLQEQAKSLSNHQGRLLIIGGGLTGIEAATELAERYPSLQVTLATKGQLGATLSPAGAAHVRHVFARLGITVEEETSIERVTANAAYCPDGRVLPFDACLWVGAFAVPKLATASGLPVDSSGRVLVDEALRVINQPAIYAAGDVAATGLRMACATAMPMGAYVADHLAAQLQGKPAPAPFGFSYLIQCISLGRHDGLVQTVRADDTPKPQIITGWAAARIKELICSFTVWSLYIEKRWPGAYRWLQAELPATRRQQESRKQVPYGQTAPNL
ncbi:MAG: FAD-dependent oxidoreductase [Caldilineaceae bacterium]|nr:FAD-dependent oxidoreductase [Caldilineaceae bacterium]